MSPSIFRTILLVGDIDHAAQFYARVLGFAGVRVSPGRHYFDCNGTILACVCPSADGDEYSPAPNPDYLYFAVDALSATFDAVKSAGGTLSTESHHGDMGAIERRPWGEISFYANDPFGNHICFVDRKTIFTGR